VGLTPASVKPSEAYIWQVKVSATDLLRYHIVRTPWGAGQNRPDRPKAMHVLTINLEHSVTTDHRFNKGD